MSLDDADKRDSPEVIGKIRSLAEAAAPVISNVAGVPIARSPARPLSAESRRRIGQQSVRLHSLEGQNELFPDWARHRGRVSSTEVADLIDVSVLTAGRRLTALAADGLLPVPDQQHRLRPPLPARAK